MNKQFIDAVSVRPELAPEGIYKTPYDRDEGAWAAFKGIASENYNHQVMTGSEKNDPDYDFELEAEKLAEGLTNPEYKRLFKNSGAGSEEEAQRHLTHYQNLEHYTNKAAQEGDGAMVGVVLGNVADSSMLIGGGAAFAMGKALNAARVIPGVYKAARGVGASTAVARTGAITTKLGAEAVAGEAAYSGAQAAAEQGDWETFEDNMIMGLAAAGTIGVVGHGVRAVQSARRAKADGDIYDSTVNSLNAGQNPLRDIQHAGDQLAQIRQNADTALANPGDEITDLVDEPYVKDEKLAHKAQLPSRFSQTYDTESPTLKAAQRRLFTDSTAGKTDVDINVQATAADNEVDYWVKSTSDTLGEELKANKKLFFSLPEGKAWRKQYGVSILDRILDKPVNDRLGYQIHRAMSTGQIDTLPRGMREMALAIDKAQKTTYEMMKHHKVLGTEDLDHIEGYMARLHDPEEYARFMRYNGRDVKVGEDQLLGVLEESIFQGAIKAGNAMARPLARRISYILQHRVLAQGADKYALEDFLTSPNAMYKQAMDHGLSEADALDLARKAFNDDTWMPGQAAKKSPVKDANDAAKHTRLRHRIPMDLSVKVPDMKNKWGDDFQVSDLMVSDAFGLADRYIRSGMGNAAMAKRGWKSRAEIEEMMGKIREELKYASNREKAATQMLRFQNGVNRILGTTAFEETTGAMSRVALVSGMLGKHATGVMLGAAGISAMGELAKVVNRTGFKAMLDLIPALRSAADKKLLEDLREYGYYYGNSRFLGQFSHIEDYGTNAIGVLGALATQSAQATLRFSGLSLIDKHTRQAALIGWTNRLVKQVRNGKVNSRDFKASEMGWKKPTYDKIKGYIKAHGMNMEDWRLPNGHQDRETIESFIAGAHKVVSENVTRAFHGESNDFFDGPVGAMFFQFRKIVMQTYNKALIKGLSHPDAIAATNLVAGLFGAVFVSEMKAAIKTAGMDEAETKEYMKKYSLRTAIMEDGDLLNAVNHTLSFVPEFGGGAELLSYFSAPLFGVELSGRSTSAQDTFFSAPSISLAENMARAAGHVISAPFLDEPEWEDAKKRVWAATTGRSWYLFPLIYNEYMDPEND